MKKCSMYIISCFILTYALGQTSVWANRAQLTMIPPQPAKVTIGPHFVGMPLGRILLVRRGLDYCAVRFTGFGPGQLDGDANAQYAAYTRYEAYYQDNYQDPFPGKGSHFREGELILPTPWGFGRLVLSAGGKTNIDCGTFKILWSGDGNVYFRKSGQSTNPKDIIRYGIELAPTPWTNISEVNIQDPRIVWYKHDESRLYRKVLIDELWK
jgi:hypothetical protein